jgi:RNA polymerase sigma factor (sigma-70 family)
MNDSQTADTELIAQSLDGNCDAFGQIVARYQTLICSLAYSACGNIHFSEELAQQTFVTAWQQLRNLREPKKLKSWLCGIARNVARNALRRQQRAPTAFAEELNEEACSAAASPSENAISKEEEKMLWEALESLPENYREPMILFYREGESVSVVADALEISADAVKQRLSRGRVMLSEHIERTLRAALRNSSPGKAFTVGVLMALPGFTISAKAAALGAAATKGSAVAKAAAATGWFGTILSPLLILFGYYSGYRIGIDGARSSHEHKYIKSFYLKLVALIAGFYTSFALLMWWASANAKNHPLLFSGLLIGLGIFYTVAVLALAISSWQNRRSAPGNLSAHGIAARCASPAWEYRSKVTLLGLPLIHVRFGGKFSGETPVKAWIAAGNCAVGGLFAFGGMAIAPVSCGLAGIGLVSWSGMAIGLLAMGGLSLGIWSFGGLAIGWQAWGCCAIAWNAAIGAAAVAHDFALGGIAQAAQANNPIAQQAIQPTLFFRSMAFHYRHMFSLTLIWVLPLFLWWRAVARRS